MNNLKKYGIVAALVIPTIFTASNKAEASKAVKNPKKAQAVNVRTEPKEADNIIGLIDDNTSYEVLSSNNGWLKIKFEGKEAYVGTPWFNISEEATVKSPANFRKADNINSKINKVLKAGEKVEVISPAKNGYVKVKYQGKEGYVYNNLLNLPQSFVNKNYAKPAPKKVANNSNVRRSYNNTAKRSYSANTQRRSNNSYRANKSYRSNSSYKGQSSSAKEVIAQRESGGSYSARNGQYVGRYQLASSYLNGDYSPANQERVADRYVAQRYGSWDNALRFWNNNGWY